MGTAVYGVNESIRADKYTLMNRHSDEFVKWEIIEDYHTMRETVILNNSIKFYFAPAGSNLIKILFMQKDTVVISAQCDFNDYVMQSIAITS
jgi:hypothetical protein